MTAPNDGSGGSNTSTEATNNTSTTNSGSEGGEGKLSYEAMEQELRRARDDAAKYRTRSKEFADDAVYQRAKGAVEQLDKIEQDKKSEVEKLTEKNEQLLHRSSESELSLMRYKAAMAVGVDPSQVDEFASRLKGENEDDIKKDAEQLAQFFKAAGNGNNGSRADKSQGKGNEGGGTDDNSLLSALSNV